MINITNEQFLKTIFGDSYIYSHVSSFKQDPTNIPQNERGICWAGGYYKDTPLIPDSNQFYTVSLFAADEHGRSRRRKIQFSGTYVIGLDDVKEKLPLDQVMKLPPPSIVLKSSLHSEQWLYILDQPEQSRDRVDNLHDGLIKNGLAPNSKDPGQKGVTRYLRCPEGCNTKAKRVEENGGIPPRCEVTEWHPERRYKLEDLAEPFCVDLNSARSDKRVDGATDMPDHPLLHTDSINVKGKISDGRYSITCPWVDEHTDQADDGSAIFTNDDGGSFGYRCHHGNCEDRTGKDLLRYIETKSPGFSNKLKNWQIMREFSSIAEPSFLNPAETHTSSKAQEAQATQTQTMQAGSEENQGETVHEVTDVDAIQTLINMLRLQHPTSKEGRETAASILKYVDDMPKMTQLEHHNTVCDIMNWGKGEFREILKDLRKEWYDGKVSNAEFYDNTVFIRELNQFYDWKTRIFYSTEAFQNSFSNEDAEARKIALQEGRVQKVDQIDYAPKHPRIFTEGGITYANTWIEDVTNFSVPGDVSMWREHIIMLGWGEYLQHIEQWMAFTMRHPDIKINHMMIFGGGEGVGKDYILYPLAKAMGHNHTVISGDELLRDFDDHLLSTKYLHINEAELGDRREAIAVSNKLKPLAAAPPETLRVNQKGIKPIKIRNILNATMTTNSQEPIKINGVSRRFLALWSDLQVRDHNDSMISTWSDYWNIRWPWMKGEGWKHVANYLMYTVDLTGFNPAEAPPMTDFMRSIRDSSKSPMQLTVEAFVKKGHGAFGCDLASSTELCNTLKSGEIFSVDDVYVDTRYFTPVKVGLMMRQAGHQCITVYNKREATKMWVLRNQGVVANANPTDLYEDHLTQMHNIRSKTELTIVK